MKRDETMPRPLRTAGVTGLNVAVIGGTGGIGRALSRTLAAGGAHVTVVGRTFRDADVPGIEFRPADLGLMREAGRVAEQLPAESLDLLIFTTGILAAPQRQETAEGIERDTAVSYLSRLVILRAIADRLGADKQRANEQGPNAQSAHNQGANEQGAHKQGSNEHGPYEQGANGRPRVFVMGFPGNGQTGTLGDLNAERTYKSMPVHMNTVAGNEILVLDAAARYPHLDVLGLNPGFVKSEIRGNLFGPGTLRHRLFEGALGLVTTSADRYAQRLTPVLMSPDLDGHSGALLDRKGAVILPSPGLTESHRAAFLAESAELVARAGVTVS
ncbi:SDR family NAD(P)-dependent oxidoreductase [Actinoplanes sp. LDG1-06]|uniref:SDR family NAD(P)-dependent oxidoreductase n=1 Tax=Paractinoplanes ovalisporus TaxID=2810368 RepID=A0ABS2AGF5_9ACTN|nr:SDR family NAD(P)-dependent oxidoreductase [Actinoplanes ovalisporus]MBM2618334.1 SDR family NAD(P)-dependent oxidoreductase [Actinoplanes ovalisporus]